MQLRNTQEFKVKKRNHRAADGAGGGAASIGAASWAAHTELGTGTSSELRLLVSFLLSKLKFLN